MDSDLSHEALNRFNDLEARVKALEEASPDLTINDEDDEELELETEE